MRDGDGLEVRALPKGRMPAFIFRFGARWCVEHPIEALEAWTKSFVEDLGFASEKIQLSETHVRCDAPTPFTEADLERMRGVGTRNGSFNTHRYQGAISGINNLGGRKPIKFVIYDKRLEQTQKESVLWPAVWSSFGIAPDSPIWRVEARWNRKALTTLGLDKLSDLNEQTIRGLWYLFTSKYLLFVEDASVRTARTEPLQKWAKIQACGEMMETKPISAKVQVSATRLLKQATGCIAKAMAVAGIGYSEQEMERVIEEAVLVGEERFKEHRKEYLRLFLKNALDNAPEEAFASAQAVRGEIKSLISKSTQRKLVAKPFTAGRS